MKQFLFILAVLVMAGSAGAIANHTPNGIGVYWDIDANQFDSVYYEPYIQGHLYITSPTFTTFKGIELNLKSTCDGSELGYDGVIGSIPQSMGQTLSVGSLPEIVYSTSVPIVSSVELLEVYTLTFTTLEHGLAPEYEYEAIWYSVGPIYTPSIAGAAIVIPGDGAEFVQLAPFNPYYSLTGEYGTALNFLKPTPTESTSWGNLKSLYR